MRIQRNRSRLSFRTRRKSKMGCTPFSLLLIGIVVVGLTSWRWLEARLSGNLPINPQATLNDAQRAFDKGDLDNAIAISRNIWQTSPAQIDALILLARALIYRSYADYDREIDREIALQTTQNAFDQFPQNLDIRAIHAFALQANDQPVPAAQIAQEVLNRNPNHTLARVALALAYGRVGGYENALAEARQALETTEPQYRIDSLRAQAISQSDLGRYREAMITMQQAITINNKLAVLQFEYALFALQISDADTATAAYLNILAFAPANTKAQLRMCELYSTLRDPETAMRYCQAVVDHAPSWADGWYLLGREYFWQGRFAQAQDAFSRCTSLQTAQNIPTQDLHLECWYMQGQAAEILGDCDNLLRVYAEFTDITLRGNLPQTWTYPPEGPAICVGKTN